MNIFYRRSSKFFIDKTKLPAKANKPEVINALYGAVYKEFLGASKNPKYAKKSPLEKMQDLNTFAEEWLKDRKLL